MFFMENTEYSAEKKERKERKKKAKKKKKNWNISWFDSELALIPYGRDLQGWCQCQIIGGARAPPRSTDAPPDMLCLPV